MAVFKLKLVVPGKLNWFGWVFHGLYQGLFPTHYNDHVLKKYGLNHPGALELGDKCAIYLIFPKNGVQPTHLHSLRYMVAKGYAPIVVSNVKLTAADLALLQPLACQVIERVNFGYDFGGYREAVLHLGKRMQHLRRLAFFNDSAWFPLQGQMDWLDAAEAMQKDYVGAIQSGFVCHPVRKKYNPNGNWPLISDPETFHYGSFALSVGANLLKSQKFLDYWVKLRLTQGKHRTVRRGEIGLTQLVIKSGFSHGATTDLTDPSQALAGLDDQQLWAVFDNLAVSWNYKVAPVYTRLKTTLQPGPQHRDEIVDFLFKVFGSAGSAFSAPRFLIEHRNFAFLKKHSAVPTDRDAPAIVALINEFGAPLQKEMLAERGLERIAEQVAKAGQTQDS